MATALTLGRLEPNKNTVGGLKAIYFAEYDGDAYDDATFSSDEEITAFGSAIALLKYDLKGGSSISEDNPNSREAGTSFFQGSGTVILKKQDLKTRKEMKLLSWERVFVVSEDYNGNFKFHGIENGCEVAIANTSGTAMGDFNGYTLTITYEERFPAFFVSSSIIGDTINTTVTAGV